MAVNKYLNSNIKMSETEDTTIDYGGGESASSDDEEEFAIRVRYRQRKRPSYKVDSMRNQVELKCGN